MTMRRMAVWGRSWRAPLLYIGGALGICTVMWWWQQSWPTASPLPRQATASSAMATVATTTPAATAQPTSTPAPSTFSSANVETKWQQIELKYPTIQISASLRNLSTGQQVSLNDTHPYRAASTTKLIAATFFLHQVEQGVYALDDPLADHTTGYHLQRMINRSDNDSWHAFLDLMGRQHEEDFAHQHGWTSFEVATNYIAPVDLADLLQKLWEGRLVNDQHRQLLLSYMQNTIDERWIPPALPVGAMVYHKYGALEDDLHDAALISYKNQTYALVIMTNAHGHYAYQERAQLFADLVSAVFQDI